MQPDPGDAPYVVVRSAEAEGRVPVHGRLFVGRECAGVDAAHRLLLDDPKISRNHLEIRVEGEGEAVVFDTSTNGTYLNGGPIERAVPVPLCDGDTLELGASQLEFRLGTRQRSGGALKTTMIDRASAQMALVAGDVIGFSELAERSDSQALAEGLDRLFGELRAGLRRHRGMLSHVAGDAFFAAWSLSPEMREVGQAIDFALEACEIVDRVGEELPVRAADGQPLKMGWGVSLGDVALSAFTGGRSIVLGDPANVAFRLATLAGREGRGEILVTADVGAMAGDRLPNASAAPMPVKGRVTPVNVLAVRR